MNDGLIRPAPGSEIAAPKPEVLSAAPPNLLMFFAFSVKPAAVAVES
jgi:hypothetical protein